MNRSRRYIDDPNYFRLGYQLAALQLNAVLAGGDVRLDGREVSRDELIEASAVSAERVSVDAGDLLEQYERQTARRFRWSRLWFRAKLEPREERLQRFLLETVRPSAELVLAGALRERGDAVAADRIFESIRALASTGTLSYRSFYNLACYEASQGRNYSLDEQRDSFAVALDDLRQALRRVHGRRRVEVVRWASEDPSFVSLREDPLFGGRFKDLLARYGPMPAIRSQRRPPWHRH